MMYRVFRLNVKTKSVLFPSLFRVYSFFLLSLVDKNSSKLWWKTGSVNCNVQFELFDIGQVLSSNEAE